MSGLGGRLAAPPVKQPPKARLLVELPPASQVPVADVDNLRRLPPCDLLGHGPQNYFLYFRRPLHRGLRVGSHAVHALTLTACKADKITCYSTRHIIVLTTSKKNT